MDEGTPACVQDPEPGHLDRLVPGADRFADHECLEVTGAVRVVPADGAVARRGARQRVDARIPPAFRVPEPGTSIALRHMPFVSLATNAWKRLEPSW